MTATITRWVLAHKRLVIGFWVVLTLVGGETSRSAVNAMKQKFSVPGKEGWQTNVEIARLYHGTGGNAAPLVPLGTLPAGTTASAARTQLAGLERRISRTLPGARVTGYGSTGDRAFVSRDGRTAFAVSYPTPDPDQ